MGRLSIGSMTDAKQKCIIDMYNAEILHREVYSNFSKSEKDPKTKAIMAKLTRLEEKHAALWGDFLAANKQRIPKYSSTFRKNTVWTILAARKVFGLALTIKTIEHREGALHAKLGRILKTSGITDKEKRIIEKIRESEEKEETPLEERIVEYGKFFSNIRDVMFGMNDGLVEILGVAVGLAVALRVPLIILIAGFIVAVSGTLSMAAGAYLSTGYEKGIGDKEKGRTGSAAMSAFYVGLFYFVGALFPLAPFALGQAGYTAVILSIVFTAVVLTISSSLIALASEKSITREVTRTLLVSIGVAVVAILLGAYVRAAFHINV